MTGSDRRATQARRRRDARAADAIRAPAWAPEVRAPAAWQALAYLRDPEAFFTSARARHGDAFTIRMLGERWLVLAHPDAVGEVFSHGAGELDSGEPNHVLRPVIGTRNLLLMDGDEHLHRRRMVLPSFHGTSLRRYEGLIRETAATEFTSWPCGTATAALPRMEGIVFAVMLRCVLGTDACERTSALARTLRAMLGWITHPRRLLVFFLLGPDELMRLRAFAEQIRALDREVRELIARRRAASDLADRGDILSLLLRARDPHGRNLTDQELRDELITLLVAGYENTAATLAWAVHELSRSPCWQVRLAEERAAVADAVVAETLRLRPPVPLLVRRLREPLVVAGNRLEEGTNISPCSLLVHRRADLYPEPLRFDPQRFIGARPIASRWFPFGGSVRRCVGAAFAQFEARIVLEELTRALTLRPARAAPERARARAIVLVPSAGARVIALGR
jgi:cytochrome P450